MSKQKSLRARKKADGPGPNGSWTKGWPSNPGLKGWALIRERTCKARKRAKEFNAAREPLADIYAAVEGLQCMLDRYVESLAREQRRREPKKLKKPAGRVQLLRGEGCPRLYKSRLTGLIQHNRMH